MASEAPSPAAVARLAGGAPLAMLPIGGGRNSRVYRLDMGQGRSYALKAYFRHPGDTRDRLGVEFQALSFLWEQGLCCLPEPLALDREQGLGLYGFLAGERPLPPTDSEVDLAARFLVALKALDEAPGAEALPEASEATFSLQALLHNLQLRFDRLGAVDPAVARDSGLTAFLEADLRPAWERLGAECQQHYRQLGFGLEADLPREQRTLSPSDFGFHNALRGPSGLVFLDFEYFGWDDPAKMLADFLLHPGMELSLAQRRHFAATLLDNLDLEGLARRTRLLFPLYGLKWCLILLNEFLPGALDRRIFADDRPTISDRQQQQLEKCRTQLHQLLDDHEHFPYFPC